MCDFCEREENDLITCNQSGIIRTCFQDNEGNFLYNGEIGAGDAVDGSELSFFWTEFPQIHNDLLCDIYQQSTFDFNG